MTTENDTRLGSRPLFHLVCDGDAGRVAVAGAAVAETARSLGLSATESGRIRTLVEAIVDDAVGRLLRRRVDHAHTRVDPRQATARQARRAARHQHVVGVRQRAADGLAGRCCGSCSAIRVHPPIIRHCRLSSPRCSTPESPRVCASILPVWTGTA